MAWNDPFVTLVENTVEELGSFLQNKGELAIHEIARTQEVCRDFCNFLCKDIHKATKKDYTVYLQLHAMTPEDEDAYAIMLSNIRAFCETSKPETIEPEPVQKPQVRKRVATNNMSLSEQELRDMFTVADSTTNFLNQTLPRNFTENYDPSNEETQGPVTQTRQRKSTNACSLTENDLRGLFIDNQPNPLNNAPHHNSGLIIPGHNSKPHLNSGLIAVGQIAPTSQALSLEDIQTASKATPQSPQKAINAPTPLPTSGKSISMRVNKNEFSLDALEEQLINEANNQPSSQKTSYSGLIRDAQRAAQSAPSDASENVQNVPRGSYADLFAINRDTDEESTFATGAVFDPNKTTAPFALLDTPENDPEAAQKIDLTRDVKGVEYDFSQASIRKMRDFEKKKKLADIDTQKVKPIDESLLGNFRPYLHDGKYVINMPLPIASEMCAHKTSFITRILLPCAPTAILIALAALLFTFSSPIGAILGWLFLILAVITAIIVLPEVLPTQQQTPQATLCDYIRCKNGRCYSKAHSLLAVSQSAPDTEFDLHELWAPEPSWFKAFIARFDTPKVPELKNVTGTDIQNAHLFIHVDGDNYWLLPMIRIKDKWYITNPKMTVLDAKNS